MVCFFVVAVAVVVVAVVAVVVVVVVVPLYVVLFSIHPDVLPVLSLLSE